jgi:tripartite-type tricarboxylate transporter receptor subunit TctC
VRIIVPNPPGGSSDVVGRLLAGELATRFGQAFVVENRGGAGGNIGTEAIARAAPDGTTIGIGTVTQWVTNSYLYRRLPIDPMRDLSFIAISWENPNVFIVPTRFVPATSVAEFIAWAKQRGGPINFSSSGVGFTSHLLPELFGLRTGIPVSHVPFRGASEAVPTMLRGEVLFAIDNAASWRPLIDRGDVRALAITDSVRSDMAPGVPTMAEIGMPELTCTVWAGFVGPAGLPQEAVDRLSGALRDLAGRADLAQRILTAGARMTYEGPAEMRARAERERPLWAELVRVSGARLD